MSEVSRDCDSYTLYQIFPISRIGLATYFLAAIYLLLSWNSFQRLSKVRLFSAQWTTHKMLHWFLFCFTIVRAVLFGIIAALSTTTSKLADANTDKDLAVLVILFIFPDFVFISVYVLLFFNWLEMYVFCHEQYLFDLQKFQKLWKILYAAFNLALVTVQVFAYVRLYAASKSCQLNLIYYIIMYSNFTLPGVFAITGMYFHFFVIAGFAYTSSLANTRVRQMGKILLVWSACRLVRGITLKMYSFNVDWGQSIDIDFFSILIVASILIAEVIPFNMLMDWSTVSLLLLSDERDTYWHQTQFENDSVGSPRATRIDMESQWEIDPSELQVCALGMGSKENDLSSTIFGSWRNSQVTVTMFRTSADFDSPVLEELVEEVAELNHCNHEHIANFIGHSIVGSTVYVVYEYLRRGSLHDFIRQQSRPFQLDFIVRIGQQICSAMMYLHDTCRPARIHGGLSSKTVFLNQDMGASLINIGLNRLKTYSEVMMVTRLDTAWSSPEQIAGSSVTPASDVYSFGIILWELCTLESPFPNANDNSGFFRKTVLRKQERPPTNIVSNRELLDIMTQCWAQHPENRPSFSEVNRMLEDVKSPF